MSDEEASVAAVVPAVVAQDSVEDEMDDSVELAPVPFQRRVRRTQSNETQALDALEDSFSNHGGTEEVTSRPAARSNRVSVLAAGRLQRTTNMRDIFENMAKKSNATPIQALPERRKRVVQPPPVKHVDSSPETTTTTNSEDTRPLPAPRLIMNPNYNILKDDNSNDLTTAHAPKFNDIPKPTDFSDSKTVTELMQFLENGGDESRQLVQNLLDQDIIHDLILQEMVGRDGFIRAVKRAADSKQIDMTELTFALLSDDV